MYPADDIKLPDSFQPQHNLDQGDYFVRDEMLLPFPRTEKETQSFIGEYYAMVTHLDTQVGLILDAVEKSGEADNTIIIYTADHGLAVGKHGLTGKQNQYDHSIRAPFIMSGKGIPKGKEVNGMFYLNSAFPTTAELAGIEIPDSVDAPSIVPLINGEKEQMFENIVGSYRMYQRMIRNNNFKLIYYPITKEMQLFNLVDDPEEMTNLVTNRKYSDMVNTMFEQMKTELKLIDDPIDFTNPEESYAQHMTLKKNCRIQQAGCSDAEVAKLGK